MMANVLPNKICHSTKIITHPHYHYLVEVGGCRRNFGCGCNNNQIVVSPVLVSTPRFKGSHSNYVIPSIMRFFFTLLLNLK